MRTLIVTAVLFGLVATGRPAAADTQAAEAGRALASVGMNIFWVPAKAYTQMKLVVTRSVRCPLTITEA